MFPSIWFGFLCFRNENTRHLYVTRRLCFKFKTFWIVMLLKCDILGETCFWKDLVVFFWGIYLWIPLLLRSDVLGAYVCGRPLFYEVMFQGIIFGEFWFFVFMFLQIHVSVSSCLNIYVFLEGYLHVCHLPKGNLYDCIRFQISLWISFEFVPLPFGFPPECQLAFCHFVGGLVNSKIWIPLGENSKCILATVHYTNQKV